MKEPNLHVRVLEVGDGPPLLMVPGGSGDAWFFASLMLDGLRFQGSSQQDIDKMPRVAGEATYRFFQLPTYLDTWKSLVSAVANLTGGKSEYQLGADQLERIQQPVQFIWGERDPFGDLEVARRVAGVMPNARLHEMRAGHLPFLDQPQETGRVIRGFLAEETSTKKTSPDILLESIPA